MSARVYLTSGQFVDILDEGVDDIVSELTEAGPDEWYLAGDDGNGGPTRAFRISAVEAVVAS